MKFSLNSRNLFIRSLYYSKKHFTLLVILFLLVLLTSLVSLVPAYFIKYILDDILLAKNISSLNNMLLLFIIVIIAGTILDFYSNYLSSIILQNIDYDIKCSFYKHILNLPLNFFKKYRSGEIIYRLFNDTTSINSSISTKIINIFLNLFTFILLLTILFIINIKITIITLAIIPFYFLLILKYRLPIAKNHRLINKMDEEISGNVQEVVHGIDEIKSSLMEEDEIIRFSSNLKSRITFNIKNTLLKKSASIIINTISSLWALLILFYGGKEILSGNLTIGSFIAFFLIANKLFYPVSYFANYYLEFQNTLIRLKRFYSIYDLKSDNINDISNLDVSDINGTIKFDNISFGYDPNITILENISFSVKQNSITALVGRSGVGKTTLINLLLRFYEPVCGSIFIDNYNIRNITLSSLRKNIGIVLQKPYLFSGTIEENIKYGCKNITKDEDILYAAKNADAHNFIISLPSQYKTSIGERGILLSAGQQQRIALARIFLKNPKILILDEAVSSVDLQSEAIIYKTIQKLMLNRTVLIIAHRLSTIQKASNIIVLDDKSIKQIGNHEELIKKDGIYKELYKFVARI